MCSLSRPVIFLVSHCAEKLEASAGKLKSKLGRACADKRALPHDAAGNRAAALNSA